MADIITKRKRSQVMAAIRSGGNKGTEIKLITIFRAHRIIGWRRNQKLLGKPDFVFRMERLVVFVDGCFWHGCWWHCRMPSANRGYWRRKIGRNITRDVEVTKGLLVGGWRVLRVWEHSLGDASSVAARVKSELSAGHRTRIVGRTT